MAVSKRLRFEVLRRDNHQCRYCGAKAPDVVLRVDHVMPSAIGGSDDPSNLVAACEPCNSGKSSIPPDAAIVEDVRQDALRWARAIELAGQIETRRRDKELEYRDRFIEAWEEWTFGPQHNRQPIPIPGGWSDSLDTFYRYGLPIDAVLDAVRIAMSKDNVVPNETWKYFCGICWKRLEKQRELAEVILANNDERIG